MKSLGYLFIFTALIFTLSVFTIPEAHAIGGTISDGPSCVAIGGTWNGGSTCTVPSLTINSGEILTINPGIQLTNTGTITNHGTITNYGIITIALRVYIDNFGIINNNSGGIITNDGTITNYSGSIINNNSGGSINNYSTINNYFGTINNNPSGIIKNDDHIVNYGTFNNISDLIKTHPVAVLNNYARGVIDNEQTLNNFRRSIIDINTNSILENAASLSNNGSIIINPGSSLITNEGSTTSNLVLGTIINSGAAINFGSINNQNIITNNCGGGSLNFGTFTGNDLVTLSCLTALNPKTGPVGTIVTVNGTGYPVSYTIAIQYNGVDVTTTPATITTTISGAFSATFVVPPSAGTNIVTASSGSNVGKATFTVTTSSFPIIHMSDTTASFDSLISSARPFIGEYASPTSILVGKPIDSISLRMAKVGSPTGTAQVGIFDINRNVVKLFGTIDVSTIATTDTVYEFKLPANDLYTISSGDRIGIKYTGGSSSVGINVTPDRDASDPFDGTNSYRVRYETAWITSSSEDMYMILKQTHG